VYTLQADLGVLGYNVGSSGVYDTATANAVMAFEQSHDLATGGKTTMAFRDAILAALRG
jgi:peptidoglycan hydrolase-like protein with peptidoglycan-binding domain